MYLLKNYHLKDWVSFAEIYGLPLRLGKYAPGAVSYTHLDVYKRQVQG